MAHTKLSVGLIALIAAGIAGPAVADEASETNAQRPDLTGTWTNASLTGLSRPQTVDKLVVSEEQAIAIAEGTSIAGISREEADFYEDYSDPDAPAPEKGGADFGLKGYDSFWVAPGERLAKVKGEYRTSYIVEPANGQIPFTAAAKPLLAERQKVLAAIRSLDDAVFVPTPRSPTPSAGVESR